MLAPSKEKFSGLVPTALELASLRRAYARGVDRDVRYTNCWFDFHSFYEKMAKVEQYATYVEVGVWKGHSISFLADKTRDRKVRIFAVDLFEQSQQLPELQTEVDMITEIYNTNLKETNTRHLIEDIQGWSDQAAEKFKDASVDVVFIDADHQYEAVKKDILAWLPKVKPGGVISGHDFHREDSQGVVQAVTEIFGNDFQLDNTVWYKYIRETVIQERIC